MIKKFFDHKVWVILITCLVVLMLVLLAEGLSDLQFQSARPLSLGESTSIQLSFEGIAEDISTIPFWEQVVFWGMSFILVIIASLFLSPELRKRIILFFLRFVLFVVAMFYILKKFSFSTPELEQGGAVGAPGFEIAGEDIPTAVFTPPHPSSIFLYLISLGVVLAVAMIVFFISRWWLKRQRLRKASQPLEELAKIARSSLDKISSGRDWEDVIINCYKRMNDVVDAQRGLSRRKDLTASEYAARLEGAGLPGDAVRRLTRLFEAARYGARNANREEMVEAVACLNSVLYACGVSG
jgi:hypothetical protein